MEGFFTNKETVSEMRKDGKTYTCVSCGLYKTVKTPRFKPFGNFKRDILIIGTAPGKEEDETGKPWMNKAGRKFVNTMFKLGINVEEDCLSMYACHCLPKNSEGQYRIPTNYEVDCCRNNTLSVIKDRQPKLVILMGDAALYSFLGTRWKTSLQKINRWRGWMIPDQDYKCWIAPVYDPQMVEDSRDTVPVIWKQDLKAAVDQVDVPWLRWKAPEIKVITDLKELKKKVPNRIAFDYETTGLKPHSKKHKIICAGVAISEKVVYVFMIPNKKKKLKPFLDILKDPGIGKMAHNMKYEDNWTNVIWGVVIKNWEWDSMVAAHILDNRQAVTSLKFQIYVNFGVVDYASDITPYLQSNEDSGNAVNSIKKLVKLPGGSASLLKYVGYDAVGQYRLAEVQMDKMNYKDLPF